MCSVVLLGGLCSLLPSPDRISSLIREAALTIGLIDWQVADRAVQDFGSDPLLTDALHEQAWSQHAQVQWDLEDARRGQQESAE